MDEIGTPNGLARIADSDLKMMNGKRHKRILDGSGDSERKAAEWTKGGTNDPSTLNETRLTATDDLVGRGVQLDEGTRAGSYHGNSRGRKKYRARSVQK
jgi:hypothetical protein